MQQLRGQRSVWCAESASPALYRNPADALKEHVTNAIDEHLKASSTEPCTDDRLQQWAKERTISGDSLGRDAQDGNE